VTTEQLIFLAYDMSLPLDQIFLGDCREVMKTFPNKSIDLVW
jgi:DNA modification methylase